MAAYRKSEAKEFELTAQGIVTVSDIINWLSYHPHRNHIKAVHYISAVMFSKENKTRG